VCIIYTTIFFRVKGKKQWVSSRRTGIWANITDMPLRSWATLVPKPTPAAGRPVPRPISPRLIVAGHGIGSVMLGMDIQEVTFFLDVPRTTHVHPDGRVEYSWRTPPDDAGLGVHTMKDGLVYEVFVANDGQYATEEGFGVGSSDSKIRRTLGEPSRVETPAEGMTSLRYDQIGVAFDIDSRPEARFPNRVSRITVYKPSRTDEGPAHSPADRSSA
jgi:hypothetical protein